MRVIELNKGIWLRGDILSTHRVLHFGPSANMLKQCLGVCAARFVVTCHDFYWRYDLAELHASSKAREITSTCGNHSKYIWKWLYRHRHESSEQLRGRIIQIGLTGLRGREIAREKKRAGNRENIVIFVSETFYFVRSIPVIMDCEATVCKAHRESSGVAWPFCRHLGCAFAKHPVSR